MSIARSIAWSIPPSSSSSLRLVGIAPALLSHLRPLALLALVPALAVGVQRKLVLEQMPSGTDVRVDSEQALRFTRQTIALPRGPQQDHVRAAFACAPSKRGRHEVGAPEWHPRRTAFSRCIGIIRYTHSKPPAPLIGAVTVRSGSPHARRAVSLIVTSSAEIARRALAPADFQSHVQLP
jgi:hypothetical protein